MSRVDTPQHNGTTERKNGLILLIACALVLKMNMPKFFFFFWENVAFSLDKKYSPIIHGKPPYWLLLFPLLQILLFNFSLLFINLQALALNILFPIVSLTITSSPLSLWFLSPFLLFFLSLMMVLFPILASREQWKRKCVLYILFLNLLVLQLLVVSRSLP